MIRTGKTAPTQAGGMEPHNASLVGSPEETKAEARLAIVIVTRNRQSSLLKTLQHLESLEDRYPIIVVDNASEDNTLKMVGRQYPYVKLLALDRNYGAIARNAGMDATDQPYVAFCDDDSWWAPGSLARAIECFERHPKLGLVMSKILVEPGGRYDPCCQSMEASCLPNNFNLPGAPLLGFIACGAIVRRSAFRSAGGFHPKFGTWGEEELLAIDLVKNGWGLAYLPEVVSHHQPSKGPRNKSRRVQEVRNRLWTCWLRRSTRKVIKVTGQTVEAALGDREVRAGVTAALRGAAWVMKERDPVPRWLEDQLDLNDANRGNC